MTTSMWSTDFGYCKNIMISVQPLSRLHCHHKIMWKWAKTAPDSSKNIQLNNSLRCWPNITGQCLSVRSDLLSVNGVGTRWRIKSDCGRALSHFNYPDKVCLVCPVEQSPIVVFSVCWFEYLMCPNTGKLLGVVGLRNALTCTFPPSECVLV